MEDNLNYEENDYEEEQKIFYDKLKTSLDDTLINFNISGEENDK